MALQDSVKSLMNSRVISVLSDTPVLIAIDIILTNRFNGLPVTDKEGVLIGIVTKYDLILKRDNIRDDSKIRDVINKEPLFLFDSATIDNAVTAFAEHHRVDPIPIVNEARKVVGIISRADMVKLFKEYGIKYPSSAKPNDDNFKKDQLQNRDNLSRWVAAILIFVVLVALVYYFFF